MLYSLKIRNFALIDQLELEFGRGLNVLTGETGAGKSIILDAIDILLGGKVNSRLIRQGTQKASIEATFAADTSLIDFLKEEEIDLLEDPCLIFSREISITQESLRSRSRINGVLVNREVISKIRDRLVEITAQGQTVQLMVSDLQRDLLDLYAGLSLLKSRQSVASCYQHFQTIAKALLNRRQSEQERLQRLDLLTYQIKELESAKLTDAKELEYLLQESDRLSHVVELQQLSYQAYQLLYQNDNDNSSAAADLLAQVESILTNMVEYDNSLEPILEMIKTAISEVVEAGHLINSYGDNLEADPQRLEEVEERIRLLKQICRKYGPDLADAILYYDKLQKELQELNEGTQSIEKLEQEYKIAQEKLISVCEELTKLRILAAEKLEKNLIEELKPLAMEKVRFECRVTSCQPTATGADKVIFYFSPNPGEKLQPLASTASGGEMSRFLLALKACFSSSENETNTLIFDEIDVGVSGKVAQAIAEKLHQISQKHQVLCVTHQALVAAMADTHFRVEKQSMANNGDGIRTVVRVTNLDNHTDRREELAQLSGGHAASEAIAFAESLLIKAAAHRTSK